MARPPRIPPQPITGPIGALVKTISRRKLGSVPESLGVLWHSRPVLMTTSGTGRMAARWKDCDSDLKSLAHMAVASYVGCSACLDFGYYEAANEGLDLRKASQVPRWRESDVFTELERDVLAYAEAMSTTPLTVTDEMVASLIEHLGNEAVVELTMMIAIENERARFNSAAGLRAQGYSDVCEVPMPGLASLHAVRSNA